MYLNTAVTQENENVNIGAINERPAQANCTGNQGHALMVCLANTLKQTLNSNMLDRLQRPFSIDEAQRWSNLPPAVYSDRVGPMLNEFNNEQLAIIKAMLAAATSTISYEGYDEIEQILNADFLNENNTRDRDPGFGSGHYHLAFLGAPSTTGKWHFSFGGHHLAVGLTYEDGELTATTPSFRGVEPFGSFMQNGRENNPLQQEQFAFAAMLNSLNADEQNIARLDEAVTNLLVGPQKDGNFPASASGIRVGDLSQDKQSLVITAIETYVKDVEIRDATAIMQSYQADLADTYIAFSGTTNLDQVADYVRIEGPLLWIEISIQRAVSSEDGIHMHSVWRDKNTDYGG